MTRPFVTLRRWVAVRGLGHGSTLGCRALRFTTLVCTGLACAALGVLTSWCGVAQATDAGAEEKTSAGVADDVGVAQADDVGVAQATGSEWDAPEACPAPEGWRDATGIERAVETVRVRVQQGDAAWTAEISATHVGSVGTRQLTAEGCKELNDAVLVALSLLAGNPPPASVDPAPTDVIATGAPTVARGSASVAATTNSAPQSAGATSRPQSSKTQSPPSQSPSSQTSASPSSRHLFTVGGAFLLAAEGDEAVSLGGALDGAWWYLPFGVRAEVSARTPPGGITAASSVQLRFEVYTARVDACVGWDGWGPLLAACVGPTVQLLSARAPSIASPGQDSQWLGGASGALSAHTGNLWRGLGGWAELRGEGRFLSPGFQVQPYGSVLDFPQFTAALLLGPEFWF